MVNGSDAACTRLNRQREADLTAERKLFTLSITWRRESTYLMVMPREPGSCRRLDAFAPSRRQPRSHVTQLQVMEAMALETDDSTIVSGLSQHRFSSCLSSVPNPPKFNSCCPLLISRAAEAMHNHIEQCCHRAMRAPPTPGSFSIRERVGCAGFH